MSADRQKKEMEGSLETCSNEPSSFVSPDDVRLVVRISSAGVSTFNGLGVSWWQTGDAVVCAVMERRGD